MCKSLYLASGYIARCGELWYEPGILLIVEDGERVDVFVARDGMPDFCCGSYGYAQLDLDQLPIGLLPAAPPVHLRIVRSLAHA